MTGEVPKRVWMGAKRYEVRVQQQQMIFVDARRERASLCGLVMIGETGF